ncbi:phospholipid-transporting ATPase IF-like, partial [Lampetra planeri]
MPCVVAGQVDVTQRHVDDFSLLGLRVLCVAVRELAPEELLDTSRRLREASLALGERPQRLREAYDAIESRLTLLGASAVEDRLQEGRGGGHGVSARSGASPSGCSLGDKTETAVNVGYSCGLFAPSTTLLSLARSPANTTKHHSRHRSSCSSSGRSSGGERRDRGGGRRGGLRAGGEGRAITRDNLHGSSH